MNYGEAVLQRLRPTRIYRKGMYEAQALVAPITARFVTLRGKSFQAWGDEYPYFVDPYHTTWRNERSVEVPLARQFLSKTTGVGMEFGNVLGHYRREPPPWDVVDKYERSAGVLNIDVLDYSPARPLDFIVSISTLEHVGWDELPRQPQKADDAFEHLRSLLAAGGRMFLTVPLGHNATVDDAVLAGRWPTTRQVTMLRTPGGWIESRVPTWRPYDRRRGANAVWAAEIAAPC